MGAARTPQSGGGRRARGVYTSDERRRGGGRPLPGTRGPRQSDSRDSAVVAPGAAGGSLGGGASGCSGPLARSDAHGNGRGLRARAGSRRGGGATQIIPFLPPPPPVKGSRSAAATTDTSTSAPAEGGRAEPLVLRALESAGAGSKRALVLGVDAGHAVLAHRVPLPLDRPIPLGPWPSAQKR